MANPKPCGMQPQETACSCPTSIPTSWHQRDVPKPHARVRSQGRSLSAAPSIPGPTPAPRRTCPPASLGERLGSIFIPARRDEAAPGGTETLLGPPSHQTPVKAGFAPKSPALGPPNAVAGFVCLCFGCRESPRWLIKGFNGPWSRLICWEAAVRR